MRYGFGSTFLAVAGALLLVLSPRAILAQKLALEQFRVNDVQLHAPEVDVRSALGAPDSSATADNDCVGRVTTLYYPFGSVSLANDKVISLTCAKNCRTRDGIQLGDTVEQLVTTYGRGAPFGREGHFYRAPKLDCGMGFDLRNGRIVAMSIECDLC
jgi:hypothetical protein